MDPDLRNLRAFLAVADELSFTRAARVLHLTQQGLTNRIHRLESEIGAPLIVRTTRSVALSDVGAALLDDARAIVTRTTDTWERMLAFGARMRGTLRLGHSPAFAFGMLPRLLETLEQLAPDLEVAPCEERMDDLLAHLKEGRFDAALALHPPATSELRAEVVGVGSADVLIANSHAVAGQPVVMRRQLTEMPVLLPPAEASPRLHELVLETFREVGMEPEIHYLPRLRGYLPKELFDGTAFAMWATVVPPEYVRHGLVTIPLDGPRLRVETKLVYRAGADGPQISMLRDALFKCEAAA